MPSTTSVDRCRAERMLNAVLEALDRADEMLAASYVAMAIDSLTKPRLTGIAGITRMDGGIVGDQSELN